MHPAADTLGRLPTLHVAADAQDRAQVGRRARRAQGPAGDAVEVASVDRGSTGAAPAADAAMRGIQPEAAKPAGAERGLVPLPRRRSVRDCERLTMTVAGLRGVASAGLMPHRFVTLLDVHTRLEAIRLTYTAR